MNHNKKLSVLVFFYTLSLGQGGLANLSSEEKKPIPVTPAGPSICDIIRKFSDVALRQSSAWESGCFAIFHALKLRVAILDKDVASMTQEDFDGWVDEILQNDPRLRKKQRSPRSEDKFLAIHDVKRIILDTVGIKNLPDDIVVCDGSDINFPIFQDPTLLDSVNYFQQNFCGKEKPFYVLVRDVPANHWLCVVFFDGASFVIDSSPLAHRDIVCQMQSLFSHKVLPTSKDYEAVVRSIKKVRNKRRKIDEIKDQALRKHRFSEHFFDALSKSICSL